MDDNGGMVRPCFLVIDREYAGSISTRKLVIETAKLNVITAYSGAEGLETLARFPEVHGVVLDSGVHDMSCAEIVRGLKEINANLPVVVIGTPSRHACDGNDHYLEAFEPVKLLALLAKLVPEVAVIREREQKLSLEMA